MPRQIQQKPQHGIITSQTQQKEDAYLDKVIKLIPADVVGVYLGVFTLIKERAPKPGDDAPLQWGVLILITIIMPFYLKYAGVKERKQILISIVSFYVWVLSLGGPLYYLPSGLYSPQFLGAILVPIYTLLIPLLTYPPQSSATPPPAPVPPIPNTVTNS
jgi:hypothetical protein